MAPFLLKPLWNIIYICILIANQYRFKMKKLLFSVVAFTLCMGVSAQNSAVVNAYNYMNDQEWEKAAEYIDQAIEHEKTMGDAKTWVYRGQIYMGLAMSTLAVGNMYALNYTDETGDPQTVESTTIMWSYSFNGKAGDAVKITSKGKDAYAGVMVGDEVLFEGRSADGTAEASGTLANDGTVTYLIVDPAKGELMQERMLVSIDSYIKGASLDEKDRYEQEIGMGLGMMQAQMFNTGVQVYNMGEYEAAYQAFDKSHEIAEALGVTDTLSLYNAALAGAKCGKNQEAIAAFNQCIEYKYTLGGQMEVAELYVMAAQVMDRDGDKDGALQKIKEGRAAYPDSEMLIREELNIYLQNGDDAGAEASLQAALAKDEGNPMYYYAMGVVYNNMANPTKEIEKENDFVIACICNDESKMSSPDPAACDDRDGLKEYVYAEVGDIVDLPWPENHDDYMQKAINAYEKAINLNEGYLDALFNLGALYMNEGVALIQSIQTIPDAVMRKEVQTQAKANFCNAMPYMQEALTINQDDPAILQSLKTIYGQLDMLDRYEVISAKVNNGTPIDMGALLSKDVENDCTKE